MSKFFSTLNKQEMLYGAGFGLLPWLPYAFVTVPVCAILWAMGGSKGRSAAWRTVGGPLVVLTATVLPGTSTLLGHLFAAVSQFALLTLGYGIPTTEAESPGNADEGSTLGRFFYAITKGNHLLTDILTRGTIMGLLTATYLFIPRIIKL